MSPMLRRSLALGVVCTLCFAGRAAAVPSRSFRVTTYKDFDEGEANGVLLSSLGEASSGFGATRVDLPEAEVYSSAVAPDGTVWLGTGDQAQLYRLDGKTVKKVAKLDGVLVAALAVASDGTVYAGTVPGGRIYAVRDGTSKELCKLDGADHVWALALGPAPSKKGEAATLYAATGPNGRLHAVDAASGKNRVLWESGERHVLSLARGGDGAIYAGSADEAILYRVATSGDGAGTARAIHDFDGDEVRAIARRGDTLYVAVNEFEKKAGAAPAAVLRPHGTKIVLPPAAPAPATPSPPGRDRKGRGAVYRVDPDGRVEQIHALGDSYFTALEVDRDGNVFAAAGANGRVYEIRPDRTVLTAFDMPERQILTIAGFDGKQAVLGTGDAGAVYRVDFAPPKDASYLSKVFDAAFPSKWGRARWGASGAVSLETRSGNTARPDKTWSAWQGPAHSPHDVALPETAGEGGEGVIASPSSRYVQFRARFGRAAVLRDVTIYYQAQNQRPRVVEIAVGDDPAARLAKAARASGKPRSPVVKVQWKVENPDDDELVYRLFFREETGDTWKPLGGPEPLTARTWDWNTEAIPDGNYLLKVVASDERAAPKELALEHALISSPFLIDNRKPELIGLAVSYPLASGTARDSFSAISELAFSVDGGEFQPLGARDGVLDDLVEEFSFKLPERLAPGTHSLAVRAVDAADNVGSVQTAFRVR